MTSIDELNQRGAGKLPGHLGIVFTHCDKTELRAELAVAEHVMAPNGYLHAGAIVTLADTVAGYGCRLLLPPGASGFTTVELKSNHLGTALQGSVQAVGKPVHVGRTTQVWDVVVGHLETGRTLALFRCTQLVLYPKAQG